jgi:hypothetical protein
LLAFTKTAAVAGVATSANTIASASCSCPSDAASVVALVACLGTAGKAATCSQGAAGTCSSSGAGPATEVVRTVASAVVHRS